MTLPNFLVIGAAKSGTTSLYEYLRQHPETFMCPTKEPGFFRGHSEDVDPTQLDTQSLRRFRRFESKAVSHIDDYRALYSGAQGKAIGEATPSYLWSPSAPQKIREHIPDAKLVAILRDPAERAFSHFLMNVRTGRELSTDFDTILENEDYGEDNPYVGTQHYIRHGFYYRQLLRYHAVFPAEQIRVFLLSDLKQDPAGTLAQLFQYLEIDDSFAPDTSTKHNISSIPKSNALRFVLGKTPKGIKTRFMNKLPTAYRWYKENIRRGERPRLSTPARQKLISIFRPDITGLQDLISRDLSSWLK